MVLVLPHLIPLARVLVQLWPAGGARQQRALATCASSRLGLTRRYTRDVTLQFKGGALCAVVMVFIQRLSLLRLVPALTLLAFPMLPDVLTGRAIAGPRATATRSLRSTRQSRRRKRLRLHRPLPLLHPPPPFLRLLRPPTVERPRGGRRRGLLPERGMLQERGMPNSVNGRTARARCRTTRCRAALIACFWVDRAS